MKQTILLISIIVMMLILACTSPFELEENDEMLDREPPTANNDTGRSDGQSLYPRFVIGYI